ncbi:MAG: translation elongation factor Ts [Solirubrobacterales bacterium]|nr:translation elongation factor Ts [Solirubrobacterales bacterium]
MSSEITAADVKALRQKTGAGMMDSKAALTEAEGDVDRAVELLRVKGQASAAKRSDRGTSEGVIAAYIHANKKVGAMVEVQCETDFVARNEDFADFAYQVAMHIAATAPTYVSADQIPDDEVAAERRIFEEKAREEGKPDNVVERIVDGQVAKWSREITLLEQEHVNTEKHESKTIEQMREELAAKVGENVVISRFSCFRIGE